MNKPIRNPGDGLALCEMLYGNDSVNVASPCQKTNCNPAIAAKDGRNMASATRSVNGDSNTAQEVFDGIRDQYCSNCLKHFQKAYWEEMERCVPNEEVQDGHDR